MADDIVDNRAAIDLANAAPSSAPGWTDIGSSFTGVSLDTEIFIEGTGSIGEYATTTRSGIFYEYASDTDLSSTHIYIWVQCGVVGLLETKAAQGLTFRARGPTSSNYKEWDLAGSDIWPISVLGGWTLFCIDLEATTSRDGGTPPATSAIRSLGITFITASVMPRMVDNIWMDAMYSLADGVPAIIVEGQNGGSTPWTWADFPAELGLASGLAAVGSGGAIVLNGPVEFFAFDGADHVFDSTNEIVLWEAHEFIASDFYGITILAADGGTADFTMGIKTGTGDDATGAQGGVIAAEAASVRWFWDSDDANIDSVNMYGVLCIHGAGLQLDDAANSWISTTLLDCESAAVANAEVLRCTIIDAATADGVAFMSTDDINDIKFCSFEFSDGHAIELTGATPTAQSNVGNLFAGYTNSVDSTDAAILNSAAGALVVTNSLGSNLASNSYRNTGGGSVSVVAGVPITLTFLDDDTGLAIEGLNVILGTGPGLVDVIDNILTDSSGQVDVSYTGSVPDVLEGFAAKGSEEPTYVRRAIGGTAASGTGLIATIRMSSDA